MAATPLYLTEENKADLRAVVRALELLDALEEVPRSNAPVGLPNDYVTQTFRAYMPKLTVQIYNSAPLASELMKPQARRPAAIKPIGTGFSHWGARSLPKP